MTRLELLPLRQTVTPRGEAASAFATQGLLDGLSQPGRYRIIRYGHGGQILAADTPALVQAQRLLRQVYGPLIDFGEPLVQPVEEFARAVDVDAG